MPLKKIVKTIKPLVKQVCPNPTISISLPGPKLTFGCR